MKNANRNDQGKSVQQSYPKENTRNRDTERRPGHLILPGASGIGGQVPIRDTDIIQEDDLLQSDIDDQILDEVDSALDEAKARGELREMPGMAEIERKRARKPDDNS